MTEAVAIPTKMVLPTKKSEKDMRWISQKFGMIGPAGCGKSEFWSHGPCLTAEYNDLCNLVTLF